MANAAIEDNEGAAPTSAEVALDAYAEEDDAATQLVEPTHGEPRWLVQLTPFDRRSMETAELLGEVLAGRLSPSTRVWREGMTDWAPLEELLGAPSRPSGVRLRPAPDARGAGQRWSTEREGLAAIAALARPPLPAPAFWLVNAAVALAVAAATLGVLSAGGVFE